MRFTSGNHVHFPSFRRPSVPVLQHGGCFEDGRYGLLAGDGLT